MCEDKIYEIVKEIEAISKLINRRISSSTKCKRLNFSALMIMNQLRFGEVKTLTEISENLGLPNSTVSVIVDKLVNMGMVRRERDEADRRKVLLYITDKALEEESEIIKYHMDHFEGIFKNASEEDISTILKGLKTLEKVIVNS